MPPPIIDSLSIVVPVYNEAATIEATIADALSVGLQITAQLEVLVCDDGSRDQTAAILDRLAASEPRLRVLRRASNRGIEASIRALYGRARHDWVFLTNADRQVPMTALHALVAEVARGADLVIGVRSDKRLVYGLYRRVVSWSYDAAVRALGAPSSDPGSIKLSRRALLDRPLVATGVFAEGERLVRAAREGARVVTVPVPFRSRSSGKATGARGDLVVRAAVDVLRVASSFAIGWPSPRAPEIDFGHER